MQSYESPAPLLPPTSSNVKLSPFHPANLFDLFFRPRRFFLHLPEFRQTRYLYLCAWLYGIATVMQRFERLGLNPRTEAIYEFWQSVASSWLGYWAFILLGGAVNACVVWAVGGWWYKTRIGWSGSPEPDGFIARQIYFYSGLVYTVPGIVVNLIYTFFYPDFATAIFLAPAEYTVPLILLPFWSVIVGYIGVRTCFDTVRWKAILWIAALPIALYAFGLVALVMSIAASF